MNRLYLLLVLLIIFTCSCNTSYCIKVEGSAGKYGIDDASVEFCRDAVRSAQENAEVYVSNTGEEFVFINSKYIRQANERLVPNKQLKASREKKNLMVKQFVENITH